MRGPLGIAGKTALALVLGALPATVSAQEPGVTGGSVGTLVVAHGGGENWNAGVLAVAAELETGGPVEVAFLMGPGARLHRFQDAVGRLADSGAAAVAVVPLLVSSYSGHYEQIRYLVGLTDTLSESMRRHLEMGGSERPATVVPLWLGSGMDDAEEIASVLADRALALAQAATLQAVFLVGHGPNDPERYAQWMVNLRAQAEAVRRAGGFHDVKVGLVRDDAPEPVREEAVRQVRDIIQLQHDATGLPVIVVPVMISSGRITEKKLPNDLAGLSVVYRGEPLLPHSGVARWIEAQVLEAVLAPALRSP